MIFSKGPSTDVVRTLGLGFLSMVWAKYSIVKGLDPLGLPSSPTSTGFFPEFTD